MCISISQEGLYIAPTILAECTDDMTVVKEEVFGPVLSILVFDTEEEVIRRANDTPFGLSAAVCTQLVCFIVGHLVIRIRCVCQVSDIPHVLDTLHLKLTFYIFPPAEHIHVSG